MPVSAQALVRSDQGQFLGALENNPYPQHHLATDDDQLRFLGDVIPIPLPIAQAIIGPWNHEGDENASPLGGKTSERPTVDLDSVVAFFTRYVRSTPVAGDSAVTTSGCTKKIASASAMGRNLSAKKKKNVARISRPARKL